MVLFASSPEITLSDLFNQDSFVCFVQQMGCYQDHVPNKVPTSQEKQTCFFCVLRLQLSHIMLFKCDTYRHR